jgi:dihydrofolate synthase/folylpolyglutamate synthase
MKYQLYYEACRYLESLGKLDSPLEYMKERKPEDLEKYLLRMQDLLDRIGNPERDLKYIHVTGTAGKGTTTALIHRMLQNAGYVVGSTSSPATTTTLERIRVNDLYIEPKVFVEIVESLKPFIYNMYIEGEFGKPSYFDLILAIALTYFKQQKCDYVVLEVGMGGRYDSTNVIPAPVVSAITNIGYDHVHLLGNDLQEIAFEKAGIIKSGSSFFTTEQSTQLIDLFQNICAEKEVQFNHVEVNSNSNPNNDLVQAIGKQMDISDENINSAIQEIKLPCRFETVSENPLVILDGAHNVSKVVFSLEKLKDIEYKNLYVVFGAGEKKDAFGMIDEIVPHATSITLCPVVSFVGKSFSSEKMQKYIETKYPEMTVSVYSDGIDVLEHVQKTMDQDDALLAIGSLYLTGDLRKKWYSEENILQKRRSF